jgi:hypothetical protein
MRVTSWNLFSVLLVFWFASGCNQKLPESVSEPTVERTTKTAAPSETPSQNTTPTTEKTSGKTAIDSSFELLAHPADSYTKGEKAAFTISLKPRGEYYINQEFPTSVTTQVPKSIALEKSKLVKADATLFSKKQVKFKVVFSPSEAGKHEVNALVNFAVCTAKTCTPLRKNLTVLLKVN